MVSSITRLNLLNKKKSEENEAFVTVVHSLAESGIVKDFGSAVSDLQVLKVTCNFRLFLNPP